MNHFRIGIDFGGSKIELRLLDVKGREQFRQRISTPQNDYNACLKHIAQLVLSVKENIPLVTEYTIGMGIPGAIDVTTGLVKNANSTWLIGKPIADDIANIIGQPVAIANDANCFALSEAKDGSAQGERIVFGVIIGTGTGAGIVIDGQILEGKNRICGEWGHNPMPFFTHVGERSCYCGKTHCIETYTSGSAFERQYYEESGLYSDAAEIFVKATQGDPVANVIVENYYEGLAAALASVVNLLDPDAVVFGGGLSNAPQLLQQITTRISKYIFAAGGEQLYTKFLINYWGDASGARGAAWL